MVGLIVLSIIYVILSIFSVKDIHTSWREQEHLSAYAVAWIAITSWGVFILCMYDVHNYLCN